jgi:hypothetical protein
MPADVDAEVKKELTFLRKSFSQDGYDKKVNYLNRDVYTLGDYLDNNSQPMFKFCNIDPFYGPSDQPTGNRAQELRKVLDRLSHVGSVVLVWGRPEWLYEYWKPLFADGFAGSNTCWHLDASPFYVHRDRSRDKFTRNFTTWHSMVEAALTFTCTSKNTGKKRKTDPVPVTRNYTPEFKQKWGNENGVPSNIFSHYEPPTNACRLRDLTEKFCVETPRKAWPSTNIWWICSQRMVTMCWTCLLERHRWRWHA